MTHTRPNLSFATQELATTNIHRVEKSEAHTEVPARYARPQVHPGATRKSTRKPGRATIQEEYKKKSTKSTTHQKFTDGNNSSRTSYKHTSTRTPPVPKALQQESGQCAEIPYNNRYTLAYHQRTRSACETTLQTYSQRMSQQKPSTNTSTVSGFQAHTSTGTQTAEASQTNSFTSMLTCTCTEAPATARCVYNTYILADAMVSQSLV